MPSRDFEVHSNTWDMECVAQESLRLIDRACNEIIKFSALSISCGYFSPHNSLKIPHSSPVRTQYEMYISVHRLIKVFAFSLSYFVQYRVIFDRDVSIIYSST